MDDRQPVRGLRARPRDHPDGVSLLERALRVQRPLEQPPAAAPKPYPGHVPLERRRAAQRAIRSGSPRSERSSACVRTPSTTASSTPSTSRRPTRARSGQVPRPRSARLYGKIPTGFRRRRYGPWSPTYTTTNPALVRAGRSFASPPPPTVSTLDARPPRADARLRVRGRHGGRWTRRRVGRPLSRLRLQRLGLCQRHPSRLDRRLAGVRAADDRRAEAAADDHGRDHGVEDVPQGSEHRRAGPTQFMFDSAKVTSTKRPAGEAAATPPRRRRPRLRRRTIRRTRRRRTTRHARRRSQPALRSTSGTAAGRTAASTGQSCRCGSRRERRRCRRDRTRREHVRLASLRLRGQLSIGTGSTEETLTIASSDRHPVLTTTGATYAHGVGEPQNLTASIDYWDLELPQDVCAPVACRRSARAARRSSPARPPVRLGLSPRAG